LTHAVPGALLVANHISWIDIYVINSALPAAFVAKEEVRHWPLIGWLAARNDTVFLRRGSRGHARIINQEIAEILDQEKYVAVFPEGTTTDGTHLLHFHAALIQPALAASRPVLPVAISYWEVDGTRSPRVRQFAFKNSHFYPMPSTFKRVSSRILRNCL
jgi:1-acyl-sn-glycerol-3-phosphate acyltransferase